MEQPWACHNDSSKEVCFDEFPICAGSFYDRHLGIIVSDGSGGLKHELELTFRGVRIVIEYFSQGGLARFLDSDFDDFDTFEWVFMLVEVGFVKEFLQDSDIGRVLGEPMWDCSLVFRYLSFCRYNGCHWGVVTPMFGFGYSDLDCGEGFDL